MGYGVIPDLHELEQWMRQGLTPQQCSDRYKEKYGLHVPPGTIAVARWRHGWGRTNADHTELIPWVIRPEHRRLYDHVMLATESNRRQGKTIQPMRLRQLDAWKRRLEEDDAVVQYNPTKVDPETGRVPGWWWVNRLHGVDFDIIRMPNLDDEDEVSRLRPRAVEVLLAAQRRAIENAK